MAGVEPRWSTSCTQRVLRPDGVSLALTVSPGRRRPVLFAHGLGQTRQAWSASAQTLCAVGYPCTSFDARGHGDSDWNGDFSYAIDQMVDDLHAVAATCGAPPILVGASMGGLLGVVAEARLAPLFDALVLVDVTPRWEARGVERILGFMRAFPDGFATLQEASDVIASYLPQRRERKSPDRLRSLLLPREDGRLHWHWDPRLLGDVVVGVERYQPMLADAARALRVPVLLVSGGDSDLVSGATIDEFLQFVPHATHVAVPGATHTVAGDDNTVFTRTVLHFIESLDSEES